MIFDNCPACFSDPYPDQVNIRTGKEGWFKRVNKNTRAVTRDSQLNDDITVDADATQKMFTAAKNQVLKKPKAIVIPVEECQGAMERSSSSGIVRHLICATAGGGGYRL